MEKRYQVFVSSTYEDLKEERQEVMHALLELDCIPSGMELFPAANDDQWTIIQQIISDCDYYVIVLGGRYGSLGPDGISYTEMEYRYALETEKPILAFLHRDAESLPANKTERSAKQRRLYKQFRDSIQGKLCKYWSNCDELGSVVSRSLVRLMKTYPAVGWVRADALPDKEVTSEIIRLRRQVDELQSKLSRSTVGPVSDADELAQGDDTIKLDFKFKSKSPRAKKEDEHSSSFSATWDEIFQSMAGRLMGEADDATMWGGVCFLAEEKAFPSLRRRKAYSGKTLDDATVDYHQYQKLKIQLKALGLITKTGTIKDGKATWTLTPLGESKALHELAIKRKG